MQNRKLRITNIKLGSDPELFLYSPDRLKHIPVCGLVGGTKEEPLPITDDGFSLQEDNCSLEFCIKPASTKEEWLDSLNFAKNYIKDVVLAPLELVPSYVASVRFEPEQLECEQAQIMGCSTSYNAYTMQDNIVDRSDKNLRSSGFHIHLGYDNPDTDTNIEFIKAFDLFLLVPSVLLDKDTDRRKLYGKAGEFRMKFYGAEARGLSSYFLGTDELINWVWDATMQAIEFVNKGGIITDESRIIECINTSNKELAYEILDDYGIVIPEMLVID